MFPRIHGLQFGDQVHIARPGGGPRRPGLVLNVREHPRASGRIEVEAIIQDADGVSRTVWVEREDVFPRS